MMMSLLTRYIARQLLFTTLSVITVLTCIVWLAQSIKFVELVASKGVTMWLFLQLIFFLLPNLIIIVIPIAVLVAVIFIYNKLIGDHELVIFQSCGFSRWQIAKPALLVGLLFTVIMYVFNLYVLPASSKNFRDLEHSIKEAKSINILQAGRFNSVGSYTVYLREKLSNNDFRGALIYDMKDPQKPVTHMAEYGTIMDEDGISRLYLVNGSTQERDPKTGKPNILYFDQYTLQAEGTNKPPKRKIKHHELFLMDLLFPEEKIEKQSTKRLYFAEGHQRLISPLYCIVFTLLSVCTLILLPYNRRGRTRQIIGIAFASCLFYIVSLVLLNMQSYVALSIILLYVIIAIMIILGLTLLNDFKHSKGRYAE